MLPTKKTTNEFLRITAFSGEFTPTANERSSKEGEGTAGLASDTPKISEPSATPISQANAPWSSDQMDSMKALEDMDLFPVPEFIATSSVKY